MIEHRWWVWDCCVEKGVWVDGVGSMFWYNVTEREDSSWEGISFSDIVGGEGSGVKVLIGDPGNTHSQPRGGGGENWKAMSTFKFAAFS